jgi:cyanate permease
MISQLKSIKPTKIYYGWWMVLITGLVSGLASGMYSYGVSVFFKDITVELGTSRAITSFGSSIGRVEGGVISPLTGWLGDKFGPKWIIFAGAFLVSLGMGLMYTITSIWTYLVAWGVITGLGINLGLTVAVDLALTNWFVRKRGLAMGVKFALIGVGIIFAVPIVTFLVNAFGWRITCLIWSLIIFACLPLIIIIIKNKRPEYYGLLPDGTRVTESAETSKDSIIEEGKKYASAVQEEEFTFKQAIRTRPYWIIAIAFALFAFVAGGFVLHVFPFLTDIGLSEATASGMMSLMVFLSLPSRFFGGIIADRIKKSNMRLLLVGIFALMLVGLGGFLVQPTSSRVLFLLIPYGLSSGAVTPITVLLIGRYFGRKAFGSIFGSCNFLVGVAQLISPVYAGWIYDTTGSYIVALQTFAILIAISLIVISFAKAPKTPKLALFTQ